MANKFVKHLAKQTKDNIDAYLLNLSVTHRKGTGTPAAFFGKAGGLYQGLPF